MRSTISPQLLAGWDVDLDDAGVWGDGEVDDAGVFRREIAFEDHFAAEFFRRVLDGGGEFQPVGDVVKRGVEDVEDAVAGFHRERGADQAGFFLADHRRVLRDGAETFDAGAGQLVTGLLQGIAFGEEVARGERVGLEFDVHMLGVGPGQAFQRQAQADRGVAGDEEHDVIPEKPFAGLPAARAILDDTAERQHAADRIA